MEYNKPLTLLREDFISSVAKLINESSLPLFVVEDAMRQLTNGVSELARQQLDQDRQAYAQAMMMAAAQEEPVEKVTGEVEE